MILIAIAIFYLIALIVLILGRLGLRPGFAWFLAVGGSVVSWSLLLFSYDPEPQVVTLIVGKTGLLFDSAQSLILDMVSWSFSVGIATLMISALLTDVARVKDIHPSSWATSLVLVGTGILAVSAATPVTLLMAWTLIDITEAYSFLRIVTDPKSREMVVVTFFVRIVGLMLVVAGIIRTEALGFNFSLANLPAESAGYLVLAAGLRLGVIPPHSPFIKQMVSQRSLGTIVRLIPASAGLLMLVRIAEVGVSLRWELVLMIISIWALIYGSFTWFSSINKMDGRPYWIFGMSALAVFSTLQMDSAATLSWGLALVFSGGLIFLYSTHSKKFVWLLVLGLIGFSALPFTPAWRGAAVFSKSHWSITIMACLGLATLISGYLNHILRLREPQETFERWVWLVYPLGLALLPMTHFGMNWVLEGLDSPHIDLRSFDAYWGGIICGFVAIIFSIRKRLAVFTTKFTLSIGEIFSLGWVYRFFWWGYKTASKLISYLEQLIEGDGGVLWAILFLILMLLFFVQSGDGSNGL